MKKGNWIPVDKALLQTLKDINRPFSKAEAYLSYAADVDCGRAWTINGYSKLWQWSRNKVRKFVTELRTLQGHFSDTSRTHYRHPIHLVDKGLWEIKDTSGTLQGQIEDTLKDTTNNPNPNNNIYTAKRFAEFWKVYPKKYDKKKCQAKWKARSLDSKADVLIADVINRIKNDRKWIDGYAPYPMTYINGDKWEDELEPVVKSKGGNGKGKRTCQGCMSEVGCAVSKNGMPPADRNCWFPSNVRA